ncbi:hypothetical protein A2U01_0047377, partial [Trifolium medium]|nr:hypothetical protein [Trifolium medium]
MSLKSDTTALDGKPKKDWSKPKSKPNRLKPLPSWLKPVSEGQISKEHREFVFRECYKGLEDYIKQS